MLKLILPAISFLVGAIPFGYIVARLVKGVDIRTQGSGNVGATNVFRVVGKSWGILVFCLDFLKGFIIVFLACLAKDFGPYLLIITGVLAICGHNWTPFLGFKGGKGVATSLGVLFALSFAFVSLKIILPIALLVWIIVFILARMVSLASLLASFVFMVLALFLSQGIQIKFFTILLFLFILIKHKSNVKRILKGKENKF